MRCSADAGLRLIAFSEQVVGVPVIVTEQNSRGSYALYTGSSLGDELIDVSAALGNTVPEVDLQSLGPLHLGTVEKSLFSMVTPEVTSLLQENDLKSVIVMGIEVGQ